MSHLIEVAFKGNRKEFFLWEGDDPPKVRAPVIVEGDRGEDLGHVHATGELAAKRFAGVAHGAPALGGVGASPARRALRPAADDELRRAADLDEQNETARRAAMERVKAHGLVMKVSDAEWQWDRRKLTLYFTAEKRVDFRALVRDLASLFRTRIELKQIGVRDEAKRLNGIGRCGREYCSASWLPELRPVNLSVAKDQRLSLNPTQISGACGRLMCSLRYEHEFYVQSRKRFPKEGKVLTTARGEEKVVSNDIFHDCVTLRALDGEVRVVALAALRHELEALASGHAAFGAGGADDDIDVDAATEELPTAERLFGESDRADTRREQRPREDTDDIDDRRPRAAGNGTTDAVRRAGGERREGERRESDRRDAAREGQRDAQRAVPPNGDVDRDAPREIQHDAAAPTPPAAPVVHPLANTLPQGDADVADAPDDGDDDAADGTEAADATTTPAEGQRPRRRRGRRGGRRGRGGGGSGSSAPGPVNDDSSDATPTP